MDMSKADIDVRVSAAVSSMTCRAWARVRRRKGQGAGCATQPLPSDIELGPCSASRLSRRAFSAGLRYRPAIPIRSRPGALAMMFASA